MDRQVSNEEVLRHVGGERSLVNTVIECKKSWIGHVLRHDCLLKSVIEGRMEGKRCRGRKRIGMLDKLKEGGDYVVMKRRARTCLRAENRTRRKKKTPC